MFETPEFWVAVGFVLFVGSIYRPAGRGIGAMLDSRSARIKATLDEAAQLREEAQHLLAEYQRKQRDAIKETEEMLAKSHQQAERLAVEAAETLERALAHRQELALDKIAQAEAEALREVREVAIEIAIDATRRLIADRLDQSRADALLDDAISDLKTKLH